LELTLEWPSCFKTNKKVLFRKPFDPRKKLKRYNYFFTMNNLKLFNVFSISNKQKLVNGVTTKQFINTKTMMMKDLIKKSFSTGNYSESVSIGLLIFRLAVGIFMLTHGYGKLQLLLAGGPIQFIDPIGIGPAASLVLVVFAEFFCSIFLIFGVATRFSAVTLLITMLVAALIFHGSDPFAVQEKALLYAAMYFLLIFTGAGKYSADKFISEKL